MGSDSELARAFAEGPDPSRPFAWIRRGNLLGETPTVLAWAARSWRWNWDEEAYSDLVSAMRHAEFPREAQRFGERLAKRFPSPDLLDELAWTADELGDRKRADALRPDRAPASLFQAAERRWREGNLGSAIELFREYLDSKPSNPQAWLRYGDALRRTGDPAGAEGAYANALAIAPREPRAHFGRVASAFLRGQEPRALELAEAAFVVVPWSALVFKQASALRMRAKGRLSMLNMMRPFTSARGAVRKDVETLLRLSTSTKRGNASG